MRGGRVVVLERRLAHSGIAVDELYLLLLETRKNKRFKPSNRQDTRTSLLIREPCDFLRRFVSFRREDEPPCCVYGTSSYDQNLVADSR